MTWGHASNAKPQGLTATDFRALLRNSEGQAISGPVMLTEPQQRFAGVLALTQIEVMSAAQGAMRKSDPRRNKLARATCSVRDAILRGGK